MAELATTLDKLQEEIKIEHKKQEKEMLESGEDPLMQGFAGGGNGKDTEKENEKVAPSIAANNMLKSFAGNQKKEGIKPSGGG